MNIDMLTGNIGMHLETGFIWPKLLLRRAQLPNIGLCISCLVFRNCETLEWRVIVYYPPKSIFILLLSCSQ